MDKLIILVKPGAVNQGSHVHLYVTDANGRTGTWYGFYPNDSNKKKRRPTGPGFLSIRDNPTVDTLTRGRRVEIDIGPEQSRLIRRQIFTPTPPYDLERFNCSTWAATVIQPLFPSLNAPMIRTPHNLFRFLEPYHGQTYNPDDAH